MTVDVTADELRFEAEVPATLDLAERARLGVVGLIGVTDPGRRCQPHQAVRPYRSPPVLSPEPGGYVFECGNEMWGKHAEALVEMRLMSGSDHARTTDEEVFRGMTSCIEDDGLYYSYIRRVDGERLIAAEDFSNLLGGARVVLALLAKHQADGNDEWLRAAGRLVEGLRTHAHHHDDYSYYPDGHVGGSICRPRSGWKEIREPMGTSLSESRDFYESASNVLFSHGGIVQALCRYHLVTGDREPLDLASRIVRFMSLPRFWQPDAAPEGIVPSEHAWFEGHIHATTRGLWGMLEYAIIASDERLKLLVRDGYEYVRCFGIPRIGLFGEGCTVGDMTALAVKLSEAGVGDYRDDVEQYVRNHLTELQILEPDRVLDVARACPQAPVRSWEDPDRFGERIVGLLCDDGLHPTLATPGLMLCCTYNGLIGLYHAFSDIVRSDGETARVNLLLNRASPWLDVDSFMPYEGRVVIRNRSAARIAVRIPPWVEPRQLSCTVNGRAARPFTVGRYAVFDGTAPADAIEIEFPVAESTSEFTVGWGGIPIPGWTEVTRLLDQEQPVRFPDYQVSAATRPHTPGPRFTIRFRGHEAVDISPRETGVGYPLYRRPDYRSGRAPSRRVMRIVNPRLIDM